MKKNETISCVNYNPRPEWERWTGSNRCPHCGSDEIEYNTIMILASNPPQSKLRCKSCGHYFSSGLTAEWTNKDALDMVTPLIRDPLLGETPYIGDYPGLMDNGSGDKPPYTIPMPHYPPDSINYGWICPKCGRVLAPHVNSCPYCSEPTTINITY